ncbi:hypothetical protein FQR65_LT16518 [Abscondita terminalis]|nr:hypothetical protein FQR65_LT16518 [Abscondita terminalis]
MRVWIVTILLRSVGIDPKSYRTERSMAEHLKFACAYWHSFNGNGADPLAELAHIFPGSKKADVTTVRRAKDKMDAAFEFMTKMQLPYYCFHDVDLVDYTNDVAENERRLQAITAYALDKQQESGPRIKLLWGTANLFSHERYMNGAATNPDFHVLSHGAAQYDLLDDFKLNLEVNHATLAGHTFQHELQVAADAGLLGSIDANRGDEQNGWDTDQFPYHNQLNMTLESIADYYCEAERDFREEQQRVCFFAAYRRMDLFARALLIADKILEKSSYLQLRKERYQSFDTGKGAEFEKGNLSLEDLRDFAAANGEPALKSVSNQRYIYSTGSMIMAVFLAFTYVVVNLDTLFLSGSALAAQNSLKLQYDKPAGNWNEALPIGNGRLGAMVFGQPDQEQIQLNEETIWAGEPGNNVSKNAYDKIQQIRKLLFEGKAKEAQDLSNATFPRSAPSGIDYGMPYQTFGSGNIEEDAIYVITVQVGITPAPSMQIGQHNQLQEWLQDLDKPADKHRHISHLYGLFPSGQISPFRNPELLEAAKNSMIYRGDKSTGWSMGWKVNWWARLLDGDQAYKLIKDQLSPAPMEESGQSGGTYPNLLDAHPPFQLMVNFAVLQVVIRSALGGNCRLRLNSNTHLSGNAELNPSKGENSNPYYLVNAIKAPLKSEKATLKGLGVPSTTLLDFDTKANGIYTIITPDPANPARIRGFCLVSPYVVRELKKTGKGNVIMSKVDKLFHF